MTLGGRHFTIILKNMFHEEEPKEESQNQMSSFVEPLTVIQRQQSSRKSSKRELTINKEKLSFLLPGAKINSRPTKLTSAKSAI